MDTRVSHNWQTDLGTSCWSESKPITESGARVEHGAEVLEDRLRLAGTVDHAFRRHIQRRRFHLGESEAEEADRDFVTRRVAGKQRSQILGQLEGTRFELEASERTMLTCELVAGLRWSQGFLQSVDDVYLLGCLAAI